MTRIQHPVLSTIIDGELTAFQLQNIMLAIQELQNKIILLEARVKELEANDS